LVFSPSHDNLLRLAAGHRAVLTWPSRPGEDIEQAMEGAADAHTTAAHQRSTCLRWPSECQWQTGLPLTLFRHETVAVFAGLSARPADESVAVLQYHLGGSVDGQRFDESLEIKPWTGDPVLLLRVAMAMRIRELESGQATHQLLSVAEATRLAVEHNLVSRYTNYLVVLERDDGEKPLDLPDVVAIKQMAPPVSDIGYLDLPQFSRRQESHQHSSSVTEVSMSLFDNVIEFFSSDKVPRDSSDKVSRDFAQALNKRMGERNTGVVPSRIAVLVRLGLDDEIADLLHQLVLDGADESVAVFALLLLLAEVGQLDDLSAANLDIVKKLTPMGQCREAE
jgi:hypothetical protein